MPPIPPPTGPFDTTTLLGGGNDVFTGTALADYISGGDGRDSLSGGDGNDYLDGGSGNDTLLAGRGDDTVVGGLGDDRIFGGRGNQMLFGGDGNDFIQSGDGNSTIDGGTGNDVLSINASRGASFDLTGGSGLDEFRLSALSFDRDAVITIRDFVAGTDILTFDGASAASVLNLGLRYTMLAGGGFEVALPTGDTLRLTGTQTEAFWRAYGLTGADSFTGSESGDRIFTGAGDDSILAGGGNDLVVADDGADLIDGGAGNDTLNGLRGNDTIIGGEGDDLIQDSRGFNLLQGGIGNDTIWSGSDASTLEGGEGSDILIARLERGGDHVLSGGDGADSFEFAFLTPSRPGDVTILDFDLEVDRLVIMGQDGGTWLQTNGYSADATEQGLVLSYAGGTITLAGLTLDALPVLLPEIFIS